MQVQDHLGRDTKMSEASFYCLSSANETVISLDAVKMAVKAELCGDGVSISLAAASYLKYVDSGSAIKNIISDQTDYAWHTVIT